jgi:hypothetical protein
MLFTNQYLQKLSLEDCNLGDYGAIYVLDGIERNTVIQYLSLRKNKITYQGAKRAA